MAIVIPCRDPKVWEYKQGEDWMESSRKAEVELERLFEISGKIRLGADPVGAMIKFGVADGYAFYRVVKADPLTLEHIPYGDSWHADHRLLRGLVLQDIWDELKSERALSRIFRGTKSKRGKK